MHGFQQSVYVTSVSVCLCVRAWVCRRGAGSRVRRAGALPGRHQSLGDRDRRVPDARARPVAVRRLRPRQALQAGRLAQLQLHGPAHGLRARAPRLAADRWTAAASARVLGARAARRVRGPRGADGGPGAGRRAPVVARQQPLVAVDGVVGRGSGAVVVLVVGVELGVRLRDPAGRVT